jgi:hypothetical protein
MRFGRPRLVGVLSLLAGLGLGLAEGSADAAPAGVPAPAVHAPQANQPNQPNRGQPTIADRARAFAAKHNLPIRTVDVDVNGRKSTRIFMPVTDATHQAFVDEFTAGGAVLRQREGDKEHVTLALTPKDLIHNWGQQGPMFEPNQGGLYVAMDLTDVEKQHFKATVQTAQTKEFIGKNGSANCTRWLVHGCIGPEQPLSHKLGIKRSNAPSNFVKKILHAGNDLVVVGVAMSNQPGQAAQMRQQVANYDQQAAQLEQQIAQLDQQGGGRVKAYRAQVDPYHDAVEKIDAAIALRGGQPDLVRALKSKKDDIQRAMKALTDQHEAPYHARIAQLDTAVLAGRVKVRQLEIGRDGALKNARAQVDLREHERAELTRVAPAQGASEYDRKLAAIDLGIKELKGAADVAKVQRVAARAAQRTTIAQAKQELRGLGQQITKKPAVSPANVAAYDQRLAQLDGVIENVSKAIQQHAPSPGFDHQLEAWKSALTESRQEKARLVQAGSAGYNPQFGQRLYQLDGQIEQYRKALVADPVGGNAGATLAALNKVVGEREALLAKGPLAYNPAYEQRIAQLDQQIQAAKKQIEQLGQDPNQKANVVAWRTQIEQHETIKEGLVKGGPARYDAAVDQKLQQAAGRVAQARAQLAQFDAQDVQAETQLAQQLAPKQKERDELVARGAAGFSPAYDAEVKRLDAAIAQQEHTIKTYTPYGAQYAAHVQAARAQVTALEEQKAKLAATNPADFNPQFQAKMNEIDAATKAAEQRLAQYQANPAYAAHVEVQRVEIAKQQELKASLVKVGPKNYDPAHDVKLAQNAQQLAQAKTSLETLTAQHEAGVGTAKAELARNETLRTELKKHGAMDYNAAWEQRLAQLDQQIVQAEGQIKQYPGDAYAAHRAQWTQQVEQNKAVRAEVLANGPVAYNPNEPQIAQLKQQIVQNRAASAPIRLQLEALDAAANAGNELAVKFNAIPEATLMGPPPGGGAAEAIRP